jgi:hypothetical protein
MHERGGAIAIQQGRNRAGPPEAARHRPPGTEHGPRREEPTTESTSGNRSGRPGFALRRYAEAGALS